MKIRDLLHRYPSGGFTLGPLDLEGPDNRLWLVLGPSGSGKSTLLRILGGVLRPLGGTLTGYDAASKAAYLPQFPERALAGRNLAEDLSGIVRPGGEMRPRLRSALEEAGLPGVALSRRSRELSGGERRRVALALMLLTNCEFWALDEPDAALDAGGTARLIEVLQPRIETLGGLWVATHRFEIYRGLDPWVIVLDAGQIIDMGEFSRVVEADAVRRVLRLADRPPARLWEEVERRVRDLPEGPEWGSRLSLLRAELQETPGFG